MRKFDPCAGVAASKKKMVTAEGLVLRGIQWAIAGRCVGASALFREKEEWGSGIECSAGKIGGAEGGREQHWMYFGCSETVRISECMCTENRFEFGFK